MEKLAYQLVNYLEVDPSLLLLLLGSLRRRHVIYRLDTLAQNLSLMFGSQENILENRKKVTKN